jgi:hypothetical protein
MPLEVEHLRRDVKSHPDNPRFDTVEHEWTIELLDRVRTVVEEDGGPNIIAAFYGLGRHGRLEHTFTGEYRVVLPRFIGRLAGGEAVDLAGDHEREVVFRRGDVLRAARVRRR